MANAFSKTLDRLKKAFSKDVEQVPNDINKEFEANNNIEQVIKGLPAKYNKMDTSTNDFIQLWTFYDMEQSKAEQANATSRPRKRDANKNKGRKIDISKLIDDQGAMNVMNIFLRQSRNRFQLYENYDLLFSKIPNIWLAVKAYKDNIFSPDDFTKMSLTVDYKQKDVDDVITGKLNENIKTLDDIYDIENKLMKYVTESLYTGDKFVAMYKTSEELEDFYSSTLHENEGVDSLLDERYALLSENVLSESEELVLTEYGYSKKDMHMLSEGVAEYVNEYVEVTSNVSELLKEEMNLRESKARMEQHSDIIDYKAKAETLNREIEEYKDAISKASKKKTPENTKRVSELRKMLEKQQRAMNALDAKVGINNVFAADRSKDRDKKLTLEQIRGSILRELDPKKTIKIVSGETIFGYIYIENYEYNRDVSKASIGVNNIQALFLNPNDATANDHEMEKQRREFIFNIFVRNIAGKISRKFILQYPSLSSTIYELLRQRKMFKEGDKLKIIYIPANNVFHFTPNPTNEYGTSILANILFIAKVYLAVFTSTFMLKILRGEDKRYFYVQTGLGDDHEAVMQDFIRDVKQRKIKIQDLDDINYMMNIVGTFDDYVIPMFNDVKPIEMEIMPGQDVNVTNDFLEYLNKKMVSGLGIPSALIEAIEEIDLAKTLTMVNQRFLREVVSYQKQYQKIINKFMRRLYENQFGTEEKISKKSKSNENDFTVIDPNLIEFKLPAPSALNMVNAIEAMNNAGEIVAKLVEIKCPDLQSFATNEDKTREHELTKAKFTEAAYKTYWKVIDWKQIDEMYDRAEKDAIGELLKLDAVDPITPQGMGGDTSAMGGEPGMDDGMSGEPGMDDDMGGDMGGGDMNMEQPAQQQAPSQQAPTTGATDTTTGPTVQQNPNVNPKSMKSVELSMK